MQNRGTSKVGEIRFNLKGVDLRKALSMDDLGSEVAARPGFATEWELRRILDNHWFPNVKFLKDGKWIDGSNYGEFIGWLKSEFK